MSSPTVSIIIPCFNQGAYLAEAIDSAFAQRYSPTEIIVVNDGSTDATDRVARQYGDRIRYFDQAQQGPSAARNHAIRNSIGELIASLDADDRWLPDKLAHQVPRLMARPDVGLLFSGYRCFTPAAETWTFKVDDGFEPTVHDLLHLNHVTGGTVIFHRAIFDSVGGFDESLGRAEDWDLWIRIAAITRILGTSNVVAEYRRYFGTLSTDHHAMLASRLQMLAKNRSLHGKCAACVRAYRLGVREAHAVYAASLAARSKEQFQSGRLFGATRLRAASLWHNPRSPLMRLRRRQGVA